MIRVGQGFDVHRFGGAGEGIRLGGIEVPYHRVLEAHSDGDVLLHAITDALLGACGLGDIGRHFPDDDPRWRDADSAALLASAQRWAAEEGWQPVNMDATVIAQAPKLAPYVGAMREAIAQAMGVAVGAVNVKATTSEQLGFTGREEGIAALAVLLVEPIPGRM